MTWSAIIVNPTITSIAYPGSVTAADPAGGETITVTGTDFKTGVIVTVGGTTAPVVSYVSGTQITFTTPAKAAGDYDIVVTNTDTGSATYINGISYNGIPSWTTPTGSLGTFASEETISTITLQATEPDAGTITFNITSGALPTGLSLTGADIDGTTSIENADTTYNFTVTATDDESQSTGRSFSITVERYIVQPLENFTINTYEGNGSTQSIEGKIGTAASFNGSSSYVNLPVLGLGGNATRSISAWVNPATTPSSLGTVYHSGGTNAKESFIIYYQSDNKIRVEYDNRSIATTTTILNNTWTHIVATYNGGSIESSANTNIYINGVLQTVTNSGSATGVANTLNTDYAIGYRRYANTLYFDGKIDQVRIFNKAISSSEVTTLYGENNASTTKSTTDIFDDGSGVALYEFEEGAKDKGNAGTAIDSGQSASFIGTSSNYIQLPSGIDTILNTKNFGLSFWVKAPNAVTDAVFSTETTNSTFQIHANWGFAGAYGLLNGGGSDINLGAIDSFWHHIVVTSDGSSSYKGYFDKVYKGASAYRQTSNVGTFLGAHPSGGFNLVGEIDQVRIFNRQLSQSDINSLYSETSPSTVDYFSDGNGKALYRLDGNANDTSGFYNATWNGTAAYSGPAYTGQTLYNGTPTNVSFVGTSFEPDFVWIKSRSNATNNELHDSLRGEPSRLFSDSINAEMTVANGFVSLDSNGFSLDGAGSGGEVNYSGRTYVAWCWKAASSDSTNTDGTITSTVRANQAAGFSVVKYTGNNIAGATIGHGLSSAPDMIIVKNLDTTDIWTVQHSSLGYTQYIDLSSTNAAATNSSVWYAAPTSTTFSFGANPRGNGSGNDIIAYCFHSVDGYQKVGSYTGDGGSSNAINLGFQPRWVMIKLSSHSGQNWYIMDDQRENTSVEKALSANSSAAEETLSNHLDFTSTGFTLTKSSGAFNTDGYTYIYLAIA
jgi:hypothetical protein